MSSGPSRITDASAPAPAAPAGHLKDAKEQVKENPAKNAVVTAPTPAADAASTAAAAKIQEAVGGSVTISQSKNDRSRRTNKFVYKALAVRGHCPPTKALRTDGSTGGPIDGRMDGPTDVWTDRRTNTSFYIVVAHD